jgi:hypothetical protein
VKRVIFALLIGAASVWGQTEVVDVPVRPALDTLYQRVYATRDFWFNKSNLDTASSKLAGKVDAFIRANTKLSGSTDSLVIDAFGLIRRFISGGSAFETVAAVDSHRVAVISLTSTASWTTFSIDTAWAAFPSYDGVRLSLKKNGTDVDSIRVYSSIRISPIAIGQKIKSGSLLAYTAWDSAIVACARSQTNKDSIALMWGRDDAAADSAAVAALIARTLTDTTDTLRAVLNRAIGDITGYVTSDTTDTLRAWINRMTLDILGKASTDTTDTLRAWINRQTLDILDRATTDTTDTLRAHLNLLTKALADSADSLNNRIEAVILGSGFATTDTTDTLRAWVNRMTADILGKASTDTTDTLRAWINRQASDILSRSTTDTTDTLRAWINRQALDLTLRATTDTTDTLRAWIDRMTADILDRATTDTTDTLRAWIDRIYAYKNTCFLEGWVSVASDTITLGAIPANASVISIEAWTSQVFNADGTNQITVGYDGAPTAYATAVDVSTSGIETVPLGSTAKTVDATGRTAKAYYSTSDATNLTTGKCHVVLTWVQCTASP